MKISAAPEWTREEFERVLSEVTDRSFRVEPILVNRDDWLQLQKFEKVFEENLEDLFA